MFENREVALAVRERFLNAQYLIRNTYIELIAREPSVLAKEVDAFKKSTQETLDFVQSLVLDPLYKAHPDLKVESLSLAIEEDEVREEVAERELAIEVRECIVCMAVLLNCSYYRIYHSSSHAKYKKKYRRFVGHTLSAYTDVLNTIFEKYPDLETPMFGTDKG